MIPVFAILSLGIDCSGVCSAGESEEACASRYPLGYPGLQVSDENQPSSHVAACGVHSDGATPEVFTDTLVVGETLYQTHIVKGASILMEKSNTSGACPLFLARDNAVFENLVLSCTNDAPAIEIKGKNVRISNVSTDEDKILARAIDPYHLDVGDLSITDSVGIIVLGNIAGETVQVSCEPDAVQKTLVVIQRVGKTVTVTNCEELNLDAVINPLGTQYEIDYLHRNAEVNTTQALIRGGLLLLAGLVIALFLYTFITREKEINMIIKGKAFYDIVTTLETFNTDYKSVLPSESPTFSKSRQSPDPPYSEASPRKV